MYSFEKYFEEVFSPVNDEYRSSREAGFYSTLAKLMYDKLTPKRRAEIDSMYTTRLMEKECKENALQK